MKAFFVRLLSFGFLLGITYAYAACSFNVPDFEGELEAVNVGGDMLPTTLETPTDNLAQILLDCDEGTIATLQVLLPTRADNDVPVLETKPRSFFLYREKRYGFGEEQESIRITGGLEDELVRVGIRVGNGKDVLLASDDYRYNVTLQLTFTNEDEEAEIEMENSTARIIEAVIGRKP